MHIKPMTKTRPAPAASLEAILDLINQLLATMRGLTSVFGIQFELK